MIRAIIGGVFPSYCVNILKIYQDSCGFLLCLATAPTGRTSNHQTMPTIHIFDAVFLIPSKNPGDFNISDVAFHPAGNETHYWKRVPLSRVGKNLLEAQKSVK